MLTRKRNKDTKTKSKSSKMTTTGQTIPTTTPPVNTSPNPGPSGSSSTVSTGTIVQHKLLHKNSAVLKFCGNNGSQPADLEAFIESVDNHLNSLSLSSPAEILNEAKIYLDYSKGDLKENLMTREYRQIRTWENLKQYLRSIYGQLEQRDTVVSLAKILRDLEKLDSYYKSYMADSFLKLTEFQEILANSPWVTSDKNFISLENLNNLLYLALGLKHIPLSISYHIKDPWLPSDGFSHFTKRIEEAAKNIPNIDMTRISRPKEVGAKTDTQTDTHTVNLVQKDKVQSKSAQTHRNVKDRRQVTCYKCKKVGHTSPECRTPKKPYCSYHKTNTHHTSECRELAKHNNQNARTGVYRQTNYQHHRQTNTRGRHPPVLNGRYPNYSDYNHSYSQPPNLSNHPNYAHDNSHYQRNSPHNPPSSNRPPFHTVNQIDQNATPQPETVDPSINFQVHYRNNEPM